MNGNEVSIHPAIQHHQKIKTTYCADAHVKLELRKSRRRQLRMGETLTRLRKVRTPERPNLLGNAQCG